MLYCQHHDVDHTSLSAVRVLIAAHCQRWGKAVCNDSSTKSTDHFTQTLTLQADCSKSHSSNSHFSTVLYTVKDLFTTTDAKLLEYLQELLLVMEQIFAHF